MTPTRITAHGCEITERDRAKAEAMASRWPRFDPATMGASFVFQMNGRLYATEAIVSRRRRQAVVASGQGRSFREALDDLDGHVKRMLRRDRTRRKAFRAS